MANNISDNILSNYINPDGSVNTAATPDNLSKDTTGSSTLGKDAFLNLLVAQMKYQDPLNPSSDTEWISQMATFSSLEEMQNMNTTLANSQALSLVGKKVIMNTTQADGQQVLVPGTVDYVVMQAGKAYLYINGELYSIDDLDTVVSEEYLDKLTNGGKEPEKPEEEEEETEEEKLLKAIESLVGKMDSVADKMDSVADKMDGIADNMGSGGPDSGSSAGAGNSGGATDSAGGATGGTDGSTGGTGNTDGTGDATDDTGKTEGADGTGNADGTDSAAGTDGAEDTVVPPEAGEDTAGSEESGDMEEGTEII